MASGGLWMLALLAVGVLFTALPIWSLLLGVASTGAAIGLISGRSDAAVLASVGPRVLNLLEHDLLQALPLYLFVGLLLQRLQVGRALFETAQYLARPLGGSRALALLGVGCVIAPMSGSVAATSLLLGRVVDARSHGPGQARTLALVAAAGTIGVIVPPSLVLMLLGDMMLRAHTEASNLPGYSQGAARILNTQDVLHAALLPAVAVLLGWCVVARWQARSETSDLSAVRPPLRTVLAALVVTALVFGLLAGVFTGALLAVEAAATAGLLIAVAALGTRALDRDAWTSLLSETLGLSGALFALLVGATTFSLVFRLFGTDRWLADAVLSSPWPAWTVALSILAGVALCALVLDAFEMIFMVLPVAAPLLILRLGDAQQSAALLLLVLQVSFLVPPAGYAILVARAQPGLGGVRTAELLLTLLPWLAVPLAVTALVFRRPATVHQLARDQTSGPAAPGLSDQDIVRQMEEMSEGKP